MSKISCIIPTYDRPEFLKEAVSSVLAQTIAPLEIIVVNNGKKPVELPAEFYNKVKIFDILPNAGVAQARNFGVAVAKGDYCAFLDDDDIWNENYIKNIGDATAKGAECVVSRLDIRLGDKVIPFKNPDGDITMKNILALNPGIHGSNLVVSKTAFYKAGGFDPKLPPSEDKSLVLELLRLGIAVTTLPHNQVQFREHGGNRLTGAKKMAEGIFQFTRKYRSLMTTPQFLYNWEKIYWYRYQSGKKWCSIPRIICKIISASVRFLNKLF